MDRATINIIKSKYSKYLQYREEKSKFGNYLINFTDICSPKEKIIQNKLTGGEELILNHIYFNIPLKTEYNITIDMIIRYGKTFPIISEYHFTRKKSNINYIFNKIDTIKNNLLNFNIKTDDIINHLKVSSILYNQTSQQYRDIINKHILKFESFNINNFREVIDLIPFDDGKCAAIIYAFRLNIYSLISNKLFKKNKRSA